MVHVKYFPFIRSLYFSYALIFDWLVIFFLIGISAWLDHWLAPVAVVLIAGRMKGLTELIHELSHGNGARNKYINFVFEMVCGPATLNTVESYWLLHAEHHRYLGTADDPAQIWFDQFQILNTRRAILDIFIKPLLGRALWNLITEIIQIRLKCRNYLRNMLLFWIPTLLLVFWLEFESLFFIYWMIPLFFIYPSLAFWSEVFDHFRTESGVRTCKGSWILRATIMTHNCGYHQLHHLRPDIPWYALPKVSQKHTFDRDVVGTLTQLFMALKKIDEPKAAT